MVQKQTKTKKAGYNTSEATLDIDMQIYVCESLWQRGRADLSAQGGTGMTLSDNNPKHSQSNTVH